MRTLNRVNPMVRALAVACIAAAALCGPGNLLWSADTKADPGTAASTKPSEPKARKAPVKKLTGAELYRINCNRCHAERYPTEFNSGQWKTLMMHMRVRANLPASQAKEILKYLQEDSGS